MEESRIEAQKDNLTGEISVVKIKGYLDVVTAEALDKTICSLVAESCLKIVFDLNDVDYICSRGWSVFLSNMKEIRHKGGDIKLAGMKPGVYEVFRVLEFFWFLDSYSSVEAAVADMNKVVRIITE